MNKKHLKPIIVSALMAVSFGATTVGTTFALFTDRADTKIEVTAGVVDINLALDSHKTYSAEENENGDRVDENGAKYISKETETADVFTNGGTVTVENNLITLDRVTPGDRVTFDFASSNASNVAIKYRLKYELVEEATPSAVVSLSKGLTTKITVGTAAAKEFKGLLSYQTDWTLVEAGAELNDIKFDIELPIDKLNNYQKAKATFKVSLEAVQGNAHVEGEEAYQVGIEEGATQAEVTEVLTNLEAGDAVTLPSGTYELPSTLASDVKIVADDPETTTVDIKNVNGKGSTYNYDLEGVTIENTGAASGQGVISGSMNNGHLKNVIIDSRDNPNIKNGLRNLYVNGELVIEDSFIYGETYGIHDDAASGKIIVKNSTIYGWNSFGYTLESVTFEGCDFHTSNYGSIRFYQPGYLTNCTFSEDFIFVDIAYDNVDVTITNCPTLPNEKLFMNGNRTNSKFIRDGVVVDGVATH